MQFRRRLNNPLVVDGSAPRLDIWRIISSVEARRLGTTFPATAGPPTTVRGVRSRPRRVPEHFAGAGPVTLRTYACATGMTLIVLA
jgi:hypothetical protein